MREEQFFLLLQKTKEEVWWNLVHHVKSNTNTSICCNIGSIAIAAMSQSCDLLYVSSIDVIFWILSFAVISSPPGLNVAKIRDVILRFYKIHESYWNQDQILAWLSLFYKHSIIAYTHYEGHNVPLGVNI